MYGAWFDVLDVRCWLLPFVLSGASSVSKDDLSRSGTTATINVLLLDFVRSIVLSVVPRLADLPSLGPNQVLDSWTTSGIHYMIPMLSCICWKFDESFDEENASIANFSAPSFVLQRKALLKATFVFLAVCKPRAAKKEGRS